MANEIDMERVRQIAGSFPKGRSSLIEVLHRVQEEVGYLPVNVQMEIANVLGIPAKDVYGVVTFYNFFRMKPVGKHVITICNGTACHVKGSMKLVDSLKEEFGFEDVGDTTDDGMFTMQMARCFGACGLAPVVNIDGNIHGRMTVTKLKNVLKMYKEG